MIVIKLILATVAALAGIGCTIFILVEAFKDEIWKGIVSFLCWLYLLYYAVFEWEHDWKWPILLVSFGGNAIAAGIWRM
jgi:hypothetical protein